MRFHGNPLCSPRISTCSSEISHLIPGGIQHAPPQGSTQFPVRIHNVSIRFFPRNASLPKRIRILSLGSHLVPLQESNCSSVAIQQVSPANPTSSCLGNHRVTPQKSSKFSENSFLFSESTSVLSHLESRLPLSRIAASSP